MENHKFDKFKNYQVDSLKPIKIFSNTYYEFLIIAENSLKTMISGSHSDIFSMNDISDAFLERLNLKDNELSVNDLVYNKVHMWFEKELHKTMYKNVEMNTLIPAKQRMRIVNKLLDDLEIVFKNPFKPFKTSVYWKYFRLLLFVISIFTLFYSYKLFVILIFVFLISLIINPAGNRFKTLTLRDFSDKLVRENYMEFKNSDESINYKEVKHNLNSIFSELIRRKVTNETKFIIEENSD